MSIRDRIRSADPTVVAAWLLAPVTLPLTGVACAVFLGVAGAVAVVVLPVLALGVLTAW